MESPKFYVKRIQPELKEGMEVFYNHIKGKILSLKGRMGDDYCIIKLERPGEDGCTIIECLKSSFDYLVYA